MAVVTGLSFEQAAACEAVLADVRMERERQHRKWGEQNHPDGTGDGFADAWANDCGLNSISFAASEAKRECEAAFRAGAGTYTHILMEEMFEALAESDKAKLRAELVQIAAVAVAWVEKLDREAKR